MASAIFDDDKPLIGQLTDDNHCGFESIIDEIKSKELICTLDISFLTFLLNVVIDLRNQIATSGGGGGGGGGSGGDCCHPIFVVPASRKRE